MSKHDCKRFENSKHEVLAGLLCGYWWRWLARCGHSQMSASCQQVNPDFLHTYLIMLLLWLGFVSWLIPPSPSHRKHSKNVLHRWRFCLLRYSVWPWAKKQGELVWLKQPNKEKGTWMQHWTLCCLGIMLKLDPKLDAAIGLYLYTHIQNHPNMAKYVYIRNSSKAKI